MRRLVIQSHCQERRHNAKLAIYENNSLTTGEQCDAISKLLYLICSGEKVIKTLNFGLFLITIGLILIAGYFGVKYLTTSYSIRHFSI